MATVEEVLDVYTTVEPWKKYIYTCVQYIYFSAPKKFEGFLGQSGTNIERTEGTEELAL